LPPEDAGEWISLECPDQASAEYPLRARMGAEGILIFKAAEGLRGVERHCPHEHALLTKATLLRAGTMLKCPLHNFVFRLRDGVAVNCPGYRLKVFDIKEESGQLLARPALTG
jgi:nitrite reductase/ring-hydroxylating ferredoxin subunit